jgi:N-acetylneuraminic acid mutarotase
MNMYGTTLRSWDPSVQAWRIACTSPVRGHHEEQVGRWNGKDILQEGSRGDGTRTRWTFTEITADSFHWRGEARYPKRRPGRSKPNFSRNVVDHETTRDVAVDQLRAP